MDPFRVSPNHNTNGLRRTRLDGHFRKNGFSRLHLVRRFVRAGCEARLVLFPSEVAKCPTLLRFVVIPKPRRWHGGTEEF